MLRAGLLFLSSIIPSILGAQVCTPDSAAVAASAPRPANYVFFRRQHDRIAEPGFLGNENIAGAQLTFTWRELEPERDKYDFSRLRQRLAFLQSHGKRLVVQLQESSFSDSILVPGYLLTDTAFHGGAAREYDGNDNDPAHARFEGWVARRWDPAVRARFVKLLDTLGQEFDGRLEAIVLPETSIGMSIPSLRPADFTASGYVAAINDIMTAARRAFPRSCVIVYANFMSGEWLPGDDKGYLRAVYAHADSIGAGVGGPDLMPYRRGQLNHSYPLIAARQPGVVAGLAVQDGNLAERNHATKAKVTAEELYHFAKDRLHLDFIFWGTEEPYYSAEVLPFVRSLPSPVKGAALRGSSGDLPGRVVDVIAGNYYLQAPDTIPAGLTTLRLRVKDGAHIAVLVQLDSDHTAADLLRSRREGRPRPRWMHFMGGPGFPPPGGTANATLVLKPGNYLLLCDVEDRDRIRHFEKGMFHPLVVRASTALERAAQLPRADATVEMRDYRFAFSRPLHAGNRVLRVVNRGSVMHEFRVVHVLPGHTGKESLAWTPAAQTPRPDEDVTAIVGLLPGRELVTTLPLLAGEYVVLCVPQLSHNMIQTLRVLPASATP